MTSSGGSRSPGAATPRAVVDDLIEVRECAAMLQAMLQGSSTPPSAAGELMEGMMSSLSNALSALNTGSGGGGIGTSSSAGGRASGGRRRKEAVAGPGPHRRSSSSRTRSNSPFFKTVTANTLDDGNSWRKYGQKRIQDSPNPRSYYRCAYRPDQGCRATRQVQASEANPSEYLINYFGEHTCRDPSTIPHVIEVAAPPDCANLISFGSSTIGATTSAHTVPQGGFTRDRAVDPMMLSRFVSYSRSLPAQECCGSEEAFSRSSPAGELAAVVGSAGTTSSATVGSAPEYWLGVASDMAGVNDTGSFPSSPSSLGFMTGSFGSFGNGLDDDLFGFDP
ncbi:transcription factor WRKY45-2-like [Phragmites australis]|uniref:transcription factor WRKY45-2-like n=1 Tax=Phragmites australis TaxID=29695 RepID=UPI002D7A0EB1|nr:transcription factor WRKY45-2-like [Phragmites australis]